MVLENMAGEEAEFRIARTDDDERFHGSSRYRRLSGLAGPLDLMRKVDPEEGTRQSVTASASALELGAWRCSINFALELRKARIPFTDGLRLVGTHYWGYWEQDLPRMWPTIAQGL